MYNNNDSIYYHLFIQQNIFSIFFYKVFFKNFSQKMLVLQATHRIK